MKNLKIGVKIGLSFGLILVMLLILSVVTYNNVNHMERDAEEVIHTREIIGNIHLFIGHITNGETGQRGYMITGDKKFLEPYHQAVDHLDIHLGELKEELLQHEELRPMVHDLEILVKEKMANMELTIETLNSKGVDEARQLVSMGKGKEIMDKIRNILDEIVAKEETHLKRNYFDTEKITTQTRAAVFIIGGIALLFVILSTIYFTLTIARPLQKVAVIAGEIAAGDLSSEIEIPARNDEVGHLISSLKKMSEGLKSQIVDIREGVNVLSSSSSEIMSGVAQLAASATQTATAIGETTTTIEEVKQTAEVSNQKAKEVSADSKRNAAISKEGKQAILETTESMNIIKQKMDSIAGVVVNLSELSHTIGEITATVNDLAEQSNILAVNAAIEAAKAGDHGRGFSVVAQEIKNLANRSKEATSEVRKILNDVQKSVSKVVMSTDDGSRVVENGLDLIKQTSQAIGLLSNSVTRAAEATIQIASSSQQQLIGMDQVVVAMENIRESSSQIASTTHQTSISVNDLHQLGERLQSMIKVYKVNK